jgi:hypothetical protein
MRAGAILCGGRHLVSGLLLSNLFSLAALVLLHAYIKEARGARTADSFLLFLLAYPGAFFLGLPFSESLFLLLVAVLFVCLAREHTAGAAAAAFLLPLCRPQGIFAAIPLWIYLWNRRHRRAEDWAAAIAPLAGVAAYFAVMLGGAGDALEGFKTYRDLFPEAPGPLQLLDLGRFARAFAGVTAWHDIFGSAMDRAWFLLFLACLPALWKRDRLLFAYALPMGLVPAMTLSFVSYTRHLLLVFPVFLVLAEFFQNRPPVLRRAVLAAAWAFQLFLLARHANNYWVA